MIPRRFEPLLFGLVLSGFVSLVVSGVAAAVANGLDGNFAGFRA